MTPRLTLAQLRVFVAVAQAGGFGHAAAELGMSQSSLSEGVQSLERALGRPLLRRTSTGITLTGAGQRALEHARRALGAVDDLYLAVDETAALTGRLHVATYRSLGMHVLPPVLAALRRQHPHLDVHILDGESDGEGGQRLVLDGRADVGLLELPERTPLLTWPLIQDEYLAVFPSRRGGAPTSWAELSREPLLLPPAMNTCNVNIRGYLQQHGALPTSVMEVAEDDVILSMVEHGLGVTVMPQLAITPLRPGLIALPLPVALYRTLGVAVRPGRSGLPHIRAFVDTLRAAPLPSGLTR